MFKIIRSVELLLNDLERGHSEFQIKNFIVGHGNIWGRYKQALRELSARHLAMKETSAKIDQLVLESKKNNSRKWWQRKKDTTEIYKKINELKAHRKEKAREYLIFYRIAKGIKRQIGEIDSDRREKFELEMWQEKARRMAAIDLISIGGMQRSTVEFITQLPREMRREIWADLRAENRQKLLSILD